MIKKKSRPGMSGTMDYRVELFDGGIEPVTDVIHIDGQVLGLITLDEDTKETR